MFKGLLRSLDVVPNCSQGKLWPVSFQTSISILASHGACGSVRTAQAIQTYNKESRSIESPSRSTYQRAPPITDIRTASKSMADDHSIVTASIELSAGTVSNGDIVKSDSRFELKARYNGNLLARNEMYIWVFRLVRDPLYGI